MPLPLPHEVTDPGTMSNFREIQEYLSGTEQALAEAVLAAQIAQKAADTQPAAVVYETGQSISSATTTTLNYDHETLDTDAMHDNVTNNARVTAVHAGLYLARVEVTDSTYSGGGGGTYNLLAQIQKNGSFLTDNTTKNQQNNLETIVPLAVSDYLTTRVNQDSGGPLTINATFTVVRLSSG